MPGNNDAIWQALAAHQNRMSPLRMTDFFAGDPDRASRYQINGGGLLLDYSRNLITDETLNLFSRLIDANTLPHRVQQMIEGEKVNFTERRQALHTLLRTRKNKIPVNLKQEGEQVADCLGRIDTISSAIRNGKWTGHNDAPLREIIHIGIGGSYLGPRMASEALSSYASGGIRCHYVANVDGHHIDDVLRHLNPENTLVIVVSKSFSTIETKLNAEAAIAWLRKRIPDSSIGKHLIAVSANVQAAKDFGVLDENILPIWDWVGGRYSLWSAVGLPIAITHGFKTFRAMLDGAAAMDMHFEDAPWPENMPMMLALLGIWYHNFHGAQSHAVLPYDHRLRLLPAHLQQLDMESNGKSATTEGMATNFDTGPIVWGGEGTNGQHAFHQLLHQGTRFVSVDFILPLTPHHDRREHHDWLVANCLAQAQALMQGRSMSEMNDDPRTRVHRYMPGNRPSNTLLLDKLTPEALGALIALYEHKVFCQAMIWHINPFDQWGVELGKVMGQSIHAFINGAEKVNTIDPATEQIVRLYTSRSKRQKRPD